MRHVVSLLGLMTVLSAIPERPALAQRRSDARVAALQDAPIGPAPSPAPERRVKVGTYIVIGGVLGAAATIITLEHYYQHTECMCGPLVLAPIVFGGAAIGALVGAIVYAVTRPRNELEAVFLSNPGRSNSTSP